MLVLCRKKGERIIIGNCVTLTVVDCEGGKVRLGFEAPETIGIFREELTNAFRGSTPLQEASETRRPTKKG